ncbi:hypothetical protein QBC36DRAFT_184178 [Triangularia setosa]|uniref:Uncharacterized protein n=1 Tax=Triangularia setosa TaxID=2587417 RepID=A0AAN6W9K2_9PEZI|nr:hypothetical protein QBC36DRAFT_184178 [Podospora setosa]
MCILKIIIHHRCGHRVTSLLENCENVECRGVKGNKEVVSDKYPCAVGGCPYWGRFN